MNERAEAVRGALLTKGGSEALLRLISALEMNNIVGLEGIEFRFKAEPTASAQGHLGTIFGINVMVKEEK